MDKMRLTKSGLSLDRVNDFVQKQSSQLKFPPQTTPSSAALILTKPNVAPLPQVYAKGAVSFLNSTVGGDLNYSM